jgi:competence ComEA-like helix-hairpin-helix protein
MILLVWNTLATGAFALKSSDTDPPRIPATSPSVSVPASGNPDTASEENPRNGPMSLRQKYLLGKRIDINKALKEEISELPGISDKIAAAIVSERKRVGGFRSPEDLLLVKGIKEKRLKKILPFLMEMENN